MHMHAVLTRERFTDTKDYLFRAERPLEQELFKYHFENGTGEDCLRELAVFQMPDGGFRGMGEGDNDTSSPISITAS